MNETPKPTSQVCDVPSGCGKPVLDTPSGLVCTEHGGGVPTKDAGKQLAEVLNAADKEAAKAEAKQIVFENPHASTERAIDPRFGSIIETVFDPVDLSSEYQEIEAWLRLGERRTEEAFIRKAHEEGPSMLRRAHRIYLQAKMARENWESVNDVVFGAMRSAASRALELEKEKKIRTKQITEADIDGKCAELFADEYVAQQGKRRRAKLTEDSLGNLVEVCTIRCRHLDTMMNRLR